MAVFSTFHYEDSDVNIHKTTKEDLEKVATLFDAKIENYTSHKSVSIKIGKVRITLFT